MRDGTGTARALVPRIERAARTYLAVCDYSLGDAVAALLLTAGDDDARRYVRTRACVEALLARVDAASEPHRFIAGPGVVDAVRDAVRTLPRPIPVATCLASTCPPDHVVLETRPARRRLHKQALSSRFNA